MSIGFQNKRFKTFRRIASRFVATAELPSEEFLFSEPDRLAPMLLAPDRRGEPGPRRRLLLGLLASTLLDGGFVVVEVEFAGDALLLAESPEDAAAAEVSAASELDELDSGSMKTTCSTL